MSKRRDQMRALLAMSPDMAPEAAAVAQHPARVATGSVRSVQASLAGVEQENKTLRAQLASGLQVIELDPSLIDPSPFIDRFPDNNSESFQALKVSIAERGQEVPVLVRPHPAQADRYEAAYGHRRLRALRELGLMVRTIVRQMSDVDLVVAQGVENSARSDLSWIEQAMFAHLLDGKGFDRKLIKAALSSNDAEVSRMLSVARAIPEDVVTAIGAAPKSGRRKWLELAELLPRQGVLKRVRTMVVDAEMQQRDSDARLDRILSAVKFIPASREAVNIQTSDGRTVIRIQRVGKETRFGTSDAAFARFLEEQMLGLLAAYEEASAVSKD